MTNKYAEQTQVKEEGVNPYLDPKTQNAMMQNNQNIQDAQNTQNGSMQNNPYLNKSFNTSEILVGALIGAAATYVLTNENVQKTLFKSVLSMGAIFSGGFDEIKERFEDAKAEHEESN